MVFLFLIYDKFRLEGDNLHDIPVTTKSNKNVLVNAVRETLNHIQETEYVTAITEPTSVENKTEAIWDYFTEKDYLYEGDFESSNLSEQYTSSSPWDMYDMKPRCFSMCEPPELFFREVTFIYCVLNFN